MKRWTGVSERHRHICYRVTRRRSTRTRQNKVRFFATAALFREWLENYHDSAAELWVGFYRKATGRPSVTWPESVDEALCFGWIDGIRKKIADASYKIRFTPRKPKSTWSAVNIRRAQALQKEGRMRPAGLAAFGRREQNNSVVYSFENRESAKLPEADEREFRRDIAAWKFFQTQPPGYRRVASWWVISAKRPETRRKRLRQLIRQSREKRRIY